MIDRPNVSHMLARSPTVRPAGEEDASAIARLWNDVFIREQGIARPSWIEAEICEAAAAGDTFVAERDERVIGAVALVPHGTRLASITGAQESQVLWLAVEGCSRRAGVAEALMEQCMGCARRRGDAGHRAVDACVDGGCSEAV